jgi:hypothetical protein
MERAFRLSDSPDKVFSVMMQREVTLLGMQDIAQIFPNIALMQGEVRVSGYRSRNTFINPGPLPWPSESALPYIITDGDFHRSSKMVLILPGNPGKDDVLQRFSDFRSVTNDYAMALILESPSAVSLAIPVDFVRPIVVLLDLESGIFTLIRYTPPAAISVGRNRGVLRPDLAFVFSREQQGSRWVKVVTGGAALPLATGGGTRHHRATYHARGTQDALCKLVAESLGMPLEDLKTLLLQLDGGGV